MSKLLRDPLVKPPCHWGNRQGPAWVTTPSISLGFGCATLHPLLPHWLLLLNVLLCFLLLSLQPWLLCIKPVLGLLLLYSYVFSALYTLTPKISNTISFQVCITNPGFSRNSKLICPIIHWRILLNATTHHKPNISKHKLLIKAPQYASYSVSPILGNKNHTRQLLSLWYSKTNDLHHILLHENKYINNRDEESYWNGTLISVYTTDNKETYFQVQFKYSVYLAYFQMNSMCQLNSWSKSDKTLLEKCKPDIYPVAILPFNLLPWECNLLESRVFSFDRDSQDWV